MSAAMGFFQGTPKRVRNSRGKRAIGVRAIEVLLYIVSFLIQNKLTLYYPKSVAWNFFLGTQARVRNSRGKRAISVRATEGLLYTIVYDPTEKKGFDIFCVCAPRSILSAFSSDLSVHVPSIRLCSSRH